MKKLILFIALLLFAVCSFAGNNRPHYGIASYYNKQPNRHRTASGERYYRDSFTAACKIYPFGTYLKVSNLKDHEVVIVKVNDRGPHRRNRIIDLSHAAAEKIGIMNSGLVRVKMELATQEEIKNKNTINTSSSITGKSARESVVKTPLKKTSLRSQTGTGSAAARKKFMIQAGIYNLKHSADRLKTYLNRKNIRNVTVNKINFKGQASYKVIIGPLNTNEKEKALRLLRAKHIRGMASRIKAKSTKHKTIKK